MDLFVVSGDRISCTNSVGGQMKLQSCQSGDVAEGCGRCADRVLLVTVTDIALHDDWRVSVT